MQASKLSCQGWRLAGDIKAPGKALFGVVHMEISIHLSIL